MILSDISILFVKIDDSIQPLVKYMFKKFYGRYPDLIGKYQRSVKDMVADSFPD